MARSVIAKVGAAARDSQSAAPRAVTLPLLAQDCSAAAATTRFVEALLRDVFGLGDISRAGTRALDERLDKRLSAIT
jgi:hypothetical protein